MVLATGSVGNEARFWSPVVLKDFILLPKYILPSVCVTLEAVSSGEVVPLTPLPLSIFLFHFV